MSRPHHAALHNRVHGQICCAESNLRQALRSPSLTLAAELALQAALTSVRAARIETYNRRINPDGTLWVRKQESN